MKPAAAAALALLAAAFPVRPGLAQPAPPIDASWYLAGPIEPAAAQPRHFSLKPDPGGTAPVLASSWLLPNVLVVSDAAATGADGRPLLATGTQFFQQVDTTPTFCPVVPPPKPNANLCLVDSDGDGRLDASVVASLLLSFPRKLTSDGVAFSKLAASVPYHAVAREECACKYRIDLIYLGRRKMASMQDATFMTYIWNPGRKDPRSTYRGDNIEFDMAKLPAEADVLGAKLTNVHAEGKNLAFDLIGGFAIRPYDVPHSRRKIEWGF